MALVEWADPNNVKHGKYIGSAFGVASSGATLFRNPHVARKLVSHQLKQQSAFRWIQRVYRTLSPAMLDLYGQMGQNNPYVNARHELRYPNRYHKWIQVQRYVVLYAGSVGELDPFPDATPTTSVDITGVTATLVTVPAGYRIEVVVDRTIFEIPDDDDTAVFVYMSRPLPYENVNYSSTFHFIGAPRLWFLPSVATAFPGEVSPIYKAGDLVLIECHVMNVNRGFTVSIGRFFTTLLTRPFP